MTAVYFQVEFYSRLEGRWVPLFAKEKTEADAWRKMEELLPGEKGRVVRVDVTTTVVSRGRGGALPWSA